MKKILMTLLSTALAASASAAGQTVTPQSALAFQTAPAEHFQGKAEFARYPAIPGSPEAPRLSKQISSAWVNFAKTGAPSAQGLPAWPAYTRQNGAVMVLDKQSAVRRHHDEALMRLLAPDYRF